MHHLSLIFSHSFGNITFIFITQFFHTIHESHTCQSVHFFFFLSTQHTEANIIKKKKKTQTANANRGKEKEKKNPTANANPEEEKKKKHKQPTPTQEKKKKKKNTVNANPEKKKVKRWSKVATVDPLCVCNYNIAIKL